MNKKLLFLCAAFSLPIYSKEQFNSHKDSFADPLIKCEDDDVELFFESAVGRILNELNPDQLTYKGIADAFKNAGYPIEVTMEVINGEQIIYLKYKPSSHVIGSVRCADQKIAHMFEDKLSGHTLDKHSFIQAVEIAKQMSLSTGAMQTRLFYTAHVDYEIVPNHKTGKFDIIIHVSREKDYGKIFTTAGILSVIALGITQLVRHNKFVHEYHASTDEKRDNIRKAYYGIKLPTSSNSSTELGNAEVSDDEVGESPNQEQNQVVIDSILQDTAVQSVYTTDRRTLPTGIEIRSESLSPNVTEKWNELESVLSKSKKLKNLRIKDVDDKVIKTYMTPDENMTSDKRDMFTDKVIDAIYDISSDTDANNNNIKDIISILKTPTIQEAYNRTAYQAIKEAMARLLYKITECNKSNAGLSDLQQIKTLKSVDKDTLLKYYHACLDMRYNIVSLTQSINAEKRPDDTFGINSKEAVFTYDEQGQLVKCDGAVKQYQDVYNTLLNTIKNMHTSEFEELIKIDRIIREKMYRLIKQCKNDAVTRYVSIIDDTSKLDESMKKIEECYTGAKQILDAHKRAGDKWKNHVASIQRMIDSKDALSHLAHDLSNSNQVNLDIRSIYIKTLKVMNQNDKATQEFFSTLHENVEKYMTMKKEYEANKKDDDSNNCPDYLTDSKITEQWAKIRETISDNRTNIDETIQNINNLLDIDRVIGVMEKRIDILKNQKLELDYSQLLSESKAFMRILLQMGDVNEMSKKNIFNEITNKLELRVTIPREHKDAEPVYNAYNDFIALIKDENALTKDENALQTILELALTMKATSIKNVKQRIECMNKLMNALEQIPNLSDSLSETDKVKYDALKKAVEKYLKTHVDQVSAGSNADDDKNATAAGSQANADEPNTAAAGSQAKSDDQDDVGIDNEDNEKITS